MPRASGSTHTCWICTADGVHADASALKRTTSSSSQSQERPSSICAEVRQRNAYASSASGSVPSSSDVLGARRQQAVEVRGRGSAKPGLPRRRRLLDRIHRLPGAILARSRQPVGSLPPRARSRRGSRRSPCASDLPPPPPRRRRSPAPTARGSSRCGRGSRAAGLRPRRRRTARGLAARRPRGRRARAARARRNRALAAPTGDEGHDSVFL